ncbi:MAG: PAS domain S-box protein [bacterium]|nr:PAS domain S-box protein [bacterium]
MKTLLIIGSQSTARAKLEEILVSRNWRCQFVNNFDEVQSFYGWQDLHVFMISLEEALSKNSLTFVEQLNKHAQLVAYTDSVNQETEELANMSQLFSVVSLSHTPPWQIDMILQRAAEQAKSLVNLAKESAEPIYRKLFEASAGLFTSESLSKLLEQTCREIALGAGFDRAVLVLGDSKFRIQNAQAYFVSDQKIINIAALIGQPLMPVLPSSPLTQLGKGFKLESTKSDRDDTRNLILPLERSDGTVLGFLSLDCPNELNSELSTISEPIAILLKLTAAFIETQSLRAELIKRQGSNDSHSEDKSAELRQAQERFSRLVNLTDDIIYLTDAQGRIVYMNELFGARLGYTRENYVGQMLDSVLTDIAADSETNAHAISEIQSRTEDRVSHDIELFTKTGYRKAFALSHHWVRQGQDIVAGQGILRDVSEQRELQARLARSERLGMAGKLASGVAHEINNPLQAIASHLAGIGDKVGNDSKALESLGVVSDSVERIRLMVRSLMDLQRVETSVRSNENVNKVVDRTITLLGPQIRSAAIDVVCNLDPDLPDCLINPGEIEQVLINLILNAVEAMPLGGNLMFRSEASNDKVLLHVTDTGRGISPQIIATLFQPFATYREKGGGLGMGLYMSRNLMQQHGGDLRAESPPGSGATFTLILPMAK